MMWKWLRAALAWRTVPMPASIWTYQENRITGKRRAIRTSRCFQPVNCEWLGGGAGDGLIIDDVYHRRATVSQGWTFPKLPKGKSAISLLVDAS